MARPTELDSIQNIALWIADHDGRIDQLWSSQHKLNDKLEVRLDQTGARIHETNLRLTSVEKRMIWMACIAAAAGSTMGDILPYLVNVIGKLNGG